MARKLWLVAENRREHPGLAIAGARNFSLLLCLTGETPQRAQAGQIFLGEKWRQEMRPATKWKRHD
jgi:hypothetical protein